MRNKIKLFKERGAIMRRTSSSKVKAEMISKFEKRNPDLLLYIDNDYISELVDGIFEVLADEIADIKNNVISKDDIRRL